MRRSNALLSFLVRRGMPAAPRQVRGLPLEEPVEVLWDRFGIPHLFARSERDLMVAQGFVHAQERLWQMETLRRFAAGTLAEIAGEAAVELDHFSRLAGFADLQARAAARLGAVERELFQSYADGVNTYLTLAGGDLPLEFRTLKFSPRPYTVEELGGTIPVNAWFLQTNYLEELIAVLARRRLDAGMWNELFASSPGERLPEEDFFERFRAVEIAPLLRAAVAFWPTLANLGGGSNSWVVANGPGGRPLLANDPHLDSSVPQVWYFCHLHCPTLNVVGGSMPGLPGIVIGRNERVAWSMTNLMTDCTDLYVLRVDPDRPTRYYVGADALEMEARRSMIVVAGGPAREVTIYRTVHGTVITEVKPGVEAVLALKWYGTLGKGVMEDTTHQGLFTMARARDATQFMAAARNVASVGQNLVFADADGRIGKYATGRIPRRRGYSGRLPADGSGGCDWEGFVSSEENPQELDPPGGRIVTANQRSVGRDYPHSVSYSWTSPYRHERITELLEGCNRPEVEEFQRIQMDLYSRRAEGLLPTILGFAYRAPEAREAAATLDAWDRRMSADSAGAAVFQVFLVEFSRVLLADILAEVLPAFLSWMPFMYTAPDRLLGSHAPGDAREAAAGGAPGAANRLLGERRLEEVCEQALVRTVEFLVRALGRNRRRWRWGALHTHVYGHPGVRSGVAAWLLNRGPYPAEGSGNTINPGNFNPSRGGSPARAFEVTAIASLRLVTSLADPDRTVIMGPLGQSGRPGFRHYADMIGPWRRGEATPLPLSRSGAEAIAVTKTLLAR